MEAVDANTREVISLAQAAANIPPPKYWRRIEGIVEGEVGPEYEQAFWEVQLAVGPILRAGAENPFNKSKYTDLPSLLAQIMPHVTKAGLTLKQGTGRIICYGGVDHPKRVLLLPIWTQVRHKASGQWERIYFEMPLLKIDPQGFGSAFTYGRRYALQGFWNVAGTDDDGVLASTKPRLDADPVQDAAGGIIAQIKECKTVEELKAWQERNRSGFEVLEEPIIAQLRKAYGARMREVKAGNKVPQIEKKVRVAKGEECRS